MLISAVRERLARPSPRQPSVNPGTVILPGKPIGTYQVDGQVCWPSKSNTPRRLRHLGFTEAPISDSSKLGAEVAYQEIPYETERSGYP